MQIRKCEKADIARVGAFYDKVVAWLDERVNYPEWIYKIYPSEADVREWTEAEAQYIYEHDDEIIAAFALNTTPLENYKDAAWQRDLPIGAFLVIHALAVAPDWQGTGIGSEIMRFCREKAQAEGYQALRVDIVDGNEPAKWFFEGHDFVYAGNIMQELGPGIIKEFSLYERNW